MSGEYTAIQLIGQGGEGNVYRAVDSLGRLVAVKEAIPAEGRFDEKRFEARQKRFEQEVLLHANRLVGVGLEAHQLERHPDGAPGAVLRVAPRRAVLALGEADVSEDERCAGLERRAFDLERRRRGDLPIADEVRNGDVQPVVAGNRVARQRDVGPALDRRCGCRRPAFRFLGFVDGHAVRVARSYGQPDVALLCLIDCEAPDFELERRH
ncbi:MAG: hypothetical protein HGB21_10095, partial [Nitrospirae bacterium]|nr:hypothetical protein [Nitrospirota bacterium]